MFFSLIKKRVGLEDVFPWLWAHKTADLCYPCDNIKMDRREEPLSSEKQNAV